MSLQQLGAVAPIASIREWLTTTRIAGRSVAWYLTGWRIGLILLLALVILPNLIDQSLVTTAISIFIYALLALGLNIVVGYAGLLDLGYVAFFVIGSYTVAVGTGGILQDAHNHALNIRHTPSGCCCRWRRCWRARLGCCWARQPCACAATTWRLSRWDSARSCRSCLITCPSSSAPSA